MKTIQLSHIQLHFILSSLALLHPLQYNGHTGVAGLPQIKVEDNTSLGSNSNETHSALSISHKNLVPWCRITEYLDRTTSSCKNCTTCGPGYASDIDCKIQSKPGTCRPCRQGEYQDQEDSLTSCKYCSYCNQRVELSPCSSVKNTVCGGCKKNYGLSEAGECLLCVALSGYLQNQSTCRLTTETPLQKSTTVPTTDAPNVKSRTPSNFASTSRENIKKDTPVGSNFTSTLSSAPGDQKKYLAVIVIISIIALGAIAILLFRYRRNIASKFGVFLRCFQRAIPFVSSTTTEPQTSEDVEKGVLKDPMVQGTGLVDKSGNMDGTKLDKIQGGALSSSQSDDYSDSGISNSRKTSASHSSRKSFTSNSTPRGSPDTEAHPLLSLDVSLPPAVQYELYSGAIPTDHSSSVSPDQSSFVQTPDDDSRRRRSSIGTAQHKLDIPGYPESPDAQEINNTATSCIKDSCVVDANLGHSSQGCSHIGQTASPPNPGSAKRSSVEDHGPASYQNQHITSLLSQEPNQYVQDVCNIPQAKMKVSKLHIAIRSELDAMLTPTKPGIGDIPSLGEMLGVNRTIASGFSTFKQLYEHLVCFHPNLSVEDLVMALGSRVINHNDAVQYLSEVLQKFHPFIQH